MCEEGQPRAWRVGLLRPIPSPAAALSLGQYVRMGQPRDCKQDRAGQKGGDAKDGQDP